MKNESNKLENNSKNHTKKINLCVTSRCFMTCRGCYCNFNKNNDISFQKICEFLKYAKKSGLEKITISGGDPLARKDIRKIIKKCASLNLIINLDTTGLTLTKQRLLPLNKEKINKFRNIEILEMINYIGIPLDGSNNDIISKFRIYNGNLFEEILNILNLLEDKNVKVCINTVLHKNNIDDMENIYNILKQYNCVKKWQIFQYMSTGILGSKNAKMYEINEEQLDKVQKNINKINKNKKIIVDIKTAKERFHSYMLINPSGLAYKVNKENKIETFGQIDDKLSWENIIKNIV